MSVVAALSWATPADGNGVFDPLGIVSSSGITLAQMQLSLDPATSWLGVSGNSILVAIVQVQWFLYRFFVGVCLWLMNTALTFDWLPWVTTPVQALLTPAQQLIDSLHLTPLMFGLSALVAVAVIWRGRFGAGIGEMGAAILIAALGAGLLATPLATVTGPGGWIMTARDAGVQVSAAIVAPNAPAADAAAVRKATSARLADVFLVIPMQLVNFGKPVPTACKQAYETKLKAGPYPEDAAPIRDAVQACDSTVKAVDGITALGTMQLIQYSLMVIALITGVIGLAVMIQALLAVRDAAKLVWTMVYAIAPGAGRAQMWQVLVSLAFALVGIGLAIVGGGLYAELLWRFFQSSTTPPPGQNPTNPILAFVILDVVGLIGAVLLLIALIRHRSRAKAMAERMHRATSPTRPVSMPSFSWRNAVGPAITARALTRRMSSSAAPGAPARVFAGAAHPPGAGGPGAAVRSAAPLATRLANGSGKAALLAGKVAFGATIGAPVAVPRWTKAAQASISATRTALAGKADAGKDHVATAVGRRVSAAADYRAEYARNVRTAGRFVGRVVTGPASPSLDASPPGRNRTVGRSIAQPQGQYRVLGPETASAMGGALRGGKKPPPPSAPTGALADPSQPTRRRHGANVDTGGSSPPPRRRRPRR